MTSGLQPRVAPGPAPAVAATRGGRARRAPERAREGGLALVANVQRHVHHLAVGVTEPGGGELHSPLGQVLHRRLADVVDEALVEHRARQRRGLAQPLQGPRLGGPLVHERQRPPHRRVAHTRQPPGLARWHFVGVAAQHLDEQHLAHALEHRLAPGPLATRLLDHGMQEVRDPGAPFGGEPRHAQHPRHRGEQRVERPGVAAQEAAHHRGLVTAAFHGRGGGALRDVQRVGQLGRLGHDVHAGVHHPGAHAGRARHDVRVTLGEQDHVALVELDRLLTDDRRPARAARDAVELHHVLHAGHDHGNDLARLGGLHHPRVGALDVEEERAAQAYRAQQIGKGVGAHRTSSTARPERADRRSVAPDDQHSFPDALHGVKNPVPASTHAVRGR